MSSTFHSVFIAVIGGDTCTTTFTAMMLRLQTAVAKIPGCQVAIDFFPAIDEAISAFEARHEFRTLAIAHNAMGTPAEFFIDPIPEGYDAVISPYPMSKVDWDRVSHVFSSPGALSEAVNHVGNVYNVDVSGVPASARQKRYVEIPRSRVHEAAVYKARRGAAKFPDDPNTRILMDTWCGSNNHGQMAYAGCVGNRVLS